MDKHLYVSQHYHSHHTNMLDNFFFFWFVTHEQDNLCLFLLNEEKNCYYLRYEYLNINLLDSPVKKEKKNGLVRSVSSIGLVNNIIKVSIQSSIKVAF